jgi:hypothetical protein
MSKLETLKNKIKERGGFSTEVNNFVALIEKKAAEKITQSVQKELIEHVDTLVKDIQGLLEKQTNGFQEIIDYLEKKSGESTTQSNEGFTTILEGLEKLAKQADKTQKVSVTNPSQLKILTQAQAKQAFSEALQAIQKILLNQNEVPESVNVSYGTNEKVTRITERYASFSLITTIRYDGANKVVGWTTNKQ